MTCLFFYSSQGIFLHNFIYTMQLYNCFFVIEQGNDTIIYNMFNGTLFSIQIGIDPFLSNVACYYILQKKLSLFLL